MSDLSLFDSERLARRGLISVSVPRPHPSVPAVTSADPERIELGSSRAPLAASAAVVPLGDSAYSRELATTRQPWQQRAFEAYHRVGEVGDAAEYVGRAFSMVDLFPCVFDERGKPTPDDNPMALEILNDLGRGMEREGMDGQSALMHELGVQMTVPGEAYLLGTIGEDNENHYEILSISELALTGTTYQRRHPGQPPTNISPDSFLLRIWRPDVEWSHLAYSGLRGVLDRVDELIVLSDQVMATARSRLASSGILAIANEATSPPPRPGEVDWLTREIVEHFTTPVTNPRSSMSVAPYVLRMPRDLIESGIKKIEWERIFDDHDVDRITYCVRRIGQGMDVPIQRIIGFGGENHWGGWLVSQDEWQGYLEPKVRMVLGALTRGWYHQMLQRAGIDPDRRGIWYDPTEFLVNPNRVQDAKDGYDRGVLKAASLRRELGFTEDDAPDDEEWRKWAGVKVGDLTFAIGGPVSSPQGLPAPSSNGSSPAGPENVVEAPPSSPAIAAALPVTLSRQARLRRMSRQLAQIDQDLFKRITVAADAEVTRALEKAGNRLLSRIKGNGHRLAYADLVAGKPTHLVPMVLGPARVKTLGVDEDDLMAGMFSTFSSKVGGWIRSAQKRAKEIMAWGLSEDYGALDEEMAPRQESHHAAAVAVLTAGLAAFARDRLYSPDGTPPEKGEFDSLLAPKDVIRDVLAVAGGSNVGAPVDPTQAGVANGSIADQIFADRGVETTGFIWVWGGSERAFPPHEELDGLEFESMDDVSPWQPGDHEGCSCEVVPLRDEVSIVLTPTEG